MSSEESFERNRHLVRGPESPLSLKFLLFLLIPLVLASVGLVAYLYQKGGLKLAPEQAAIPQASPIIIGAPREVPAMLTPICDIDRTNPLVFEVVDALPNLRQIDLKGYIRKVEISQDAKMATVTITSIDGKQSYEFEIENILEQVFSGAKALKPSDLKPLDNVLATFNCNLQKGSGWKFSRMNLSGAQR